MENELISVVIPVYNAERYIGEAIESALTQTYPNLEVVIVDDGSSDKTAEIVQMYAEKDKRIKYHFQTNQGVSKASNKGIELSAGKVVARMDADDIMLPERLECQFAFLKANKEVTVVSCLANYINSRGEVTGKTYSDIFTVEDCKKYLHSERMIFCLNPGAMFWKNPIVEIGGYKEDLSIAEDIDLWNRLAEKGYYTVVMPKILMRYRIHNNSATYSALSQSSKVKWVFANIRNRRAGLPEISFQKFMQQQMQRPYLERKFELLQNLANHLYRSAGYCYGERKYFQFGYFLMVSFLLSPGYVFFKVRNQIIVK